MYSASKRSYRANLRAYQDALEGRHVEIHRKAYLLFETSSVALGRPKSQSRRTLKMSATRQGVTGGLCLIALLAATVNFHLFPLGTGVYESTGFGVTVVPNTPKPFPTPLPECGSTEAATSERVVFGGVEVKVARKSCGELELATLNDGKRQLKVSEWNQPKVSR